MLGAQNETEKTNHHLICCGPFGFGFRKYCGIRARRHESNRRSISSPPSEYSRDRYYNAGQRFFAGSH